MGRRSVRAKVDDWRQLHTDDSAGSADSAAKEFAAAILDAGDCAANDEDLSIGIEGGGAPARMGRLALDTAARHKRSSPEPLHLVQIKSRDRVRDLAEVYTHKREVDAMLDLVPGLFPSARDPGNTDRTFLEPACGSGNFLEEILRRKLTFVTTRRYGRGARYEFRILRCLASIYGIDISEENVEESRNRLRSVVNSHLDNDLNTQPVSSAFAPAAETMLATNIIQADTLAEGAAIELVAYHPGRGGTFVREWSFLIHRARVPESFADEPKGDSRPVHYSELSANPGPVAAARPHLRVIR